MKTISIDDDPENANWLQQMRKKKKLKKPLKAEEVKKLALELINKK